MRQLIIARKDLGMSPGKLSAQVAHASMAYFTHLIKSSIKKVMDPEFECRRVYDPFSKEKRIVPYRHPSLYQWCTEAEINGQNYFYTKKISEENGFSNLELVNKNDITYHYKSTLNFDPDVYENWINDIFTKTVCEAKNRNHLLKAVDKAKELGLEEGKDFFLIKDNCLTELEPEEIDENGVGRTLTCIGFRPLPDEVAHEISRKYQLYK